MNRTTRQKVIVTCVILLLVLVFLYSGLRILESTVFHKPQEEELHSKVIVKDDIRYFPRQDMTVIMVLGVEQTGKVADYKAEEAYPADMITLLIFDRQTKQCNLLSINRDTMAMMSSLNAYGKEDGTYFTQLALSHTFGTGREDSCINVRNAVSDLLGGIRIDYYYAMNMDAIALLNDAVGGVQVNVTEDFSRVDPSIQMGEMTLNGQQALNFVQSRRNVGSQNNLARMERQQIYMKGFVSALKGKLSEGAGGAMDIYEAVADYVVTDCSFSVLNRLMEDYGDYTLGKVCTLPGTGSVGKQYFEFYVDEEKADALILELFYAPIEE